MTKSVFTDRYARLLRELIAARKSADLTQEQVAKRLGRHQSFIAKIEQGQRRLDVVEFLDIADVLCADPHAIIERVRKSGS